MNDDVRSKNFYQKCHQKKFLFEVQNMNLFHKIVSTRKELGLLVKKILRTPYISLSFILTRGVPYIDSIGNFFQVKARM